MSQWKFRLKSAGNGFIVSEDDAMICDVFMTNDSAVAEGRARLIAAAPELLEACRATLVDLRVARILSEKGFDKTIATIEAALRQAEATEGKEKACT